MIRALYIALTLLSLAQAAFGGEFQITPAQQFSITPAVVVHGNPADSTCFVWRHVGGVGQAGTGTVIGCESGKSLVITCAHVVEDSNAPMVVIHGGKEYPAELLCTARNFSTRQSKVFSDGITAYGYDGPDLALVIVRGQLPCVVIAEAQPEANDRVRLWGFGGRMGWNGAVEKVGRFLGSLWNEGSVNSTIQTISGDSGSGWFNDAGELCAVHWGNDGRAWAVPLQSIRSFVGERAKGLFPRLTERMAARRAARAKSAKSAPAPAPKAKSVGKAGCVCGADCKCKDGDCPSKCPVAPKAAPKGFTVTPGLPFLPAAPAFSPPASSCPNGTCNVPTRRGIFRRW